MALFICNNCSCIENTNLADKITTCRLSKDYPNLSLHDMMGDSEEDFDTSKYPHLYNTYGGAIIDREYPKMLCSECNTGMWHGEFDKEKANIQEHKLANHSEYNYITPGTHSDAIIVADSDCRNGFRLATPDEYTATTRRRVYDESTKRTKRFLMAAMSAVGFGYSSNNTIPQTTSKNKPGALEKAIAKRERKQLKKRKIK